MNEIVERVERAIASYVYQSANEIADVDWDRAARAAISALREPTDEMEYAGANWAGGEGAARGTWTAMIDEALADE